MGESTTCEGNLTAMNDMEARKIFGTENDTMESSTISNNSMGESTLMMTIQR